MTPLPGLIFPGEFPDTFCFVPDSCLKDGQPDTKAYLVRRWDRRNHRLNRGKSSGQSLIPLEGSAPIPIEAIPKEFVDIALWELSRRGV
jgi:hypothetical protein